MTISDTLNDLELPEADGLDQVADDIHAAKERIEAGQPVDTLDPPIDGEPPMPNDVAHQAVTTTEIEVRAHRALQRARETGPPVDPIQITFWVDGNEAAAVLATEFGAAGIDQIHRPEQVHQVLAEYYHRQGRRHLGVDMAGWWDRLAGIQQASHDPEPEVRT